MKKILPLLLILLLTCCSKKKPDYAVRIDAVQTAFEQKSIDSLSPYLANGYTVKGIPEGMESMILPMIFKKIPAPKKYEITGETKEKKGTRLEVVFYGPDDKPLHSNFLIASDGKFLELNILNDAKISTSIE